MSIRILPIQFILIFLSFQLFSQTNKEPCARFVNIQQNIVEDGTIDLTFNIKNNSNADISSVIVKQIGAESQAKPFKIKPNAISESTFTFKGASPGAKKCYSIELLDADGSVYCNVERCLRTESIVYEYSSDSYGNQDLEKADTYISGSNSFIYLNDTEHQVILGRDDECCGFEALITNFGCAPYGFVEIQLIGGTPPFETNGISYVGEPEEYRYEDSELDAGTYTYVFEDSLGCIVEVTHVVLEGPEAEVLTGGCTPNAWAEVEISGGSGGYSGPGDVISPGVFGFDPIEAGVHKYVYEDSEGCTVGVRINIPDEFIIADTEVDGCNVVITVSGGTPEYYEAGDIGQGGGNQIEEGVFVYGPDDFQEDVNQWHTFIFKDQNGCTVSTTLFVPKCGKKIGPNDSEVKFNATSEVPSIDKVEVYPNPVSDDLIISNLPDSVNTSEIRIMNSSGKTLITQSYSNLNQLKLDVKSLPSGVYFVEITNTDNEDKIFEKFVKN